MQQEKYNTAECIDYIVGKTSQSIKNALYRRFKAEGYDITPEQWSVLSNLYNIDGIYQKQIGDLLFKDKPTMTRILDILEKKNLIIRIPHDKDRRKLKIYITQEGRSIVGNLIPAAEDLQLNIKMNISKHEFDQLKEILGRAHQNALNIR